MGRVRPHLLVILACLAAVLVATWPAALHLTGSIPGEKDLVGYYVYEVLMDQPVWRWLAVEFQQLNFPDGGHGVTVALPQYLLALPFVALGGLEVGYNVSILLHMAFGVYAGYRLSRRVWGDLGLSGAAAHLPHWVAGCGMGLGTHVLATYSNGQAEILGTGYILVALEAGWVSHRRGGWRAPLVCVGAVTAAFLSTPYLVMVLLLAAWPAVLWGLWRRPGRSFLLGLVGVGLVCALGAVHFRGAMAGEGERVLCPAELSLQPESRRLLPLDEPGAWRELLHPHAAGADAAVLDPPYLLRPGRADDQGWIRYNVYLGWFVTLLAGLGLALRGGRRGGLLLLLSAATPMLLALGPLAHWHGWVPTLGGYPLRAPLHFLRELPVLGGLFLTINVPARLVLGGVIPLSLLAAPGMARLAAGRLPWWLFAPLPLLEQVLLSPAAPPPILWRLPQVQAYQMLAAEPDEQAVLDTPPVGFPIGPPPVTFLRELVLESWQHQHPHPYRGCYPPLFNETVMDTMFQQVINDILLGYVRPGPDAQGRLRRALPELRQMGFGWYVVHTGTGIMDEEAELRLLAIVRAVLPLQTHTDDGGWLFRIPGAG